ncbi:hypothetical protein M404DRAFT_36392 [Pisolithus tinctorius Marx 270]|uniref:Uncharacterized protein n=1 Tax=Pisolithus tinctorius Marx 270 TaxID=870435 RepID=A0A0C3NC01_PISTI|nr:hypothetical protein M404DRAFT_36392 [Pisolithus tinctorius Marx 270]
MSSESLTRVLDAVQDVIYLEVDGFMSDWNTHCFTIDIATPGPKKIVFRLKNLTTAPAKDNYFSNQPADADSSPEEIALNKVEEASLELDIMRRIFMQAYEGSIRLQEAYLRVCEADSRLDEARNELTWRCAGCADAGATSQDLKTESDFPKFEPISASPCRILLRHLGNPNAPPDTYERKPWAYRVTPFDPFKIPMNVAKRKLREADMSASKADAPKRFKLESP